MKSQKNICITNFDIDLIRFSRINKELILELSKKFKEIYILNLHNLRLVYKTKYLSKKKDQKLFPKNFKIVDIKNSNELIKFSKNKKLIIILNGITRSVIDFKIFYLFKKIKAKLVMISITGQWGSKIFIDIPFKNILVGHKHLVLKGFYYVYRILTILNIFSKINLLIESSKVNINIFKNGFSRKFETLFPFLKISLYRKIHHVNSNVFDAYYMMKNKKIKKSKNDYILYIDSPIVSEDRIQREGPVSSEIINKYYNNLFRALSLISETFKKKILVSLHPSSIKSFTKIKKKFLSKSRNLVISKNRTSDLVYDASIVLFSISSAVLNAVILKKKIISLRSKYFGEYNLKVNDKNTKGINCPFLNIDENFKISKNEINFKFKKSISSYDKIIKQRLTNGTKKPSYIEIVEVLKRENF